MFCSGCGVALAPGQMVCPQCGRPAAPAVPPMPGFEFQVERYRSSVKALSVVWYVYAGLSLLLGFAKLTFAKAFFLGGFGPWAHSPVPPMWIGAAMHIAWLNMVIFSALAVAVGWGLQERAHWGRILAIVAAFLNLLHVFPLGAALGIWTLVMLLGYRNSTLYEQL